MKKMLIHGIIVTIIGFISLVIASIIKANKIQEVTESLISGISGSFTDILNGIEKISENELFNRNFIDLEQLFQPILDQAIGVDIFYAALVTAVLIIFTLVGVALIITAIIGLSIKHTNAKLTKKLHQDLSEEKIKKEEYNRKMKLINPNFSSRETGVKNAEKK